MFRAHSSSFALASSFALVIGFVLLAFVNSSAAQTRIGVGSDISPWFFSGYSVLATVESDAAPHWRFTGEVWGMELPEFHTNLAEENRDENWRRRVRVGVGLYIDRHFAKHPSWHVGLLLSAFSSRATRDGMSGSADFVSAEALARVGYRWFPGSQSNFFVNPWFGAGPVVDIGNDEEVGGERFASFPVQAIGTVHLGWRF